MGVGGGGGGGGGVVGVVGVGGGCIIECEILIAWKW